MKRHQRVETGESRGGRPTTEAVCGTDDVEGVSEKGSVTSGWSAASAFRASPSATRFSHFLSNSSSKKIV